MKYKKISPAQVEDMLYQISIKADKGQAKRFSKLAPEVQQKVTFCLLRRAARIRRNDMELDWFIIREVIDSAQENEFLDLE